MTQRLRNFLNLYNMAEQKFKIGEEVYIMNGYRPINVMIVNFTKYCNDPRLSEDRDTYIVYDREMDTMRRVLEEGIYRSKIEAYIEMIRKNLIEGDELSITVDEEYYTIKIKKGE